MKYGEIIRENGQILLEMAKIGEFDNFSIYVYGSEGPKPHFHLIKGNPKSPNFETCIEISSSIYFYHNNKEGILNSKQKKKLVDFLNKKHRLLNSTNWEVLVIQWCLNNPEYEINPQIKMPDYLKL